MAQAALWLNLGCGPHRADPPWWNVDVVAIGDVKPDQLVAGDSLPYPDGSVKRLYLGHVLEHIGWEELPAYMAELRRVLEPGAELLAVGPDVERAIRRFAAGLENWKLVAATLEGESSQLGEWPGARHQWNCSEARLVGLLERSGFAEVTPLPIEGSLDGWPVVSHVPWQCAVRAARPRP